MASADTEDEEDEEDEDDEEEEEEDEDEDEDEDEENLEEQVRPQSLGARIAVAGGRRDACGASLVSSGCSSSWAGVHSGPTPGRDGGCSACRHRGSPGSGAEPHCPTCPAWRRWRA